MKAIVYFNGTYHQRDGKILESGMFEHRDECDREVHHAAGTFVLVESPKKVVKKEKKNAKRA
jgi:hypothetical protein